MKEELKKEDYRSFEAQSQIYPQRATISLQPNLKASLNALIYKSAILQSRNYCSNICQIVTPIICLLFTIFVRIIVQGITTGAVQTYSYPQPINLPTYNWAIRQTLNLSCSQINYYQTDDASTQIADQIIGLQLKDYCYKQNSLNPLFVKKNAINEQVMQKLKEADTTAFQRGDDLKTQIPDGLVNFKKSKGNQLSATLSINDFRLPEYHKNNGVTKILIKTSSTSVIGTYLRVTQGMMALIDKITGPFLQTVDTTNKQIITGSYMYMPFSGTDTSLVDKVVNVIGSGLYPLGLSMLMPILLYMVVSQKQERQIEIMKMNGLDSKHYWVNYFIVSFVLCMLTSLNMYIFGTYIIDITFFTQTSGPLLLLVFVGWAIAQIAMTSLVQIFINNSKTATIVGYLLSIFSTILGEVIATLIFPLPMTFPFALLLYPPFALCRIIYYIGWSCSNTTGCYRSVSGLQSQPTMAIIILYLWFFVYLFSIWLNQMVQQEYGVAKKPQVIQKCLKHCRRRVGQNQLIEQIQSAVGGSNPNQIQLSQMQDSHLSRKDQLIDQSVAKHRAQVLDLNPLEPNQALMIRDISKRYTSDNGQIDKIALRPLTMRLIKGQIFGFLGPNGAGKTTLISVLTGMYPQSSGIAYIGGREIGRSFTNQLIGVCPQFDILWPDMTVQQHLKFYCKLKQVKQAEINHRTNELLREVDLQKQRDYRVTQLSGGMQRRLSIACALCGNPSVVILDQPTSGLDPYHRRQIWKILQNCKRKTSIFMTSHLMDEVQYLCDRIGIISQGQLRCIGDLRSLKQKFGKGYRLTISYPTLLRSEQSSIPLVVQAMIKRMNLEIVNELETRVVVKIGRKDIRQCIYELKKEVNLDWFINQPSLYDVFMHFVK